jgi:hypothetical protein
MPSGPALWALFEREGRRPEVRGTGPVVKHGAPPAVSPAVLPEARMNEFQYPVHTGLNESILNLTFGHAESLFCNETLQFEDYDKVVFSYFDPEERRKRRREVFPQDCQRAFEPGARLVKAK